MLVGAGRGFPDRPFVDLAVAHQHIDLAVPSGHPRGQCHTEADGKPVAESSRAGFDPRNHRFRMSAEKRIEMAKAIEFLEGEEAPIGQHGVERQTAMALAQDEAIMFPPKRITKIETLTLLITDA